MFTNLKNLAVCLFFSWSDGAGVNILAIFDNTVTSCRNARVDTNDLQPAAADIFSIIASGMSKFA